MIQTRFTLVIIALIALSGVAAACVQEYTRCDGTYIAPPYEQSPYGANHDTIRAQTPHNNLGVAPKKEEVQPQVQPSHPAYTSRKQ